MQSPSLFLFLSVKCNLHAPKETDARQGEKRQMVDRVGSFNTQEWKDSRAATMCQALGVTAVPLHVSCHSILTLCREDDWPHILMRTPRHKEDQ